jgi:hypothetical protein
MDDSRIVIVPPPAKRKKLISLYISEETLARIDALKPHVAKFLKSKKKPSRTDVIDYAVNKVLEEEPPAVRLREG